MSIYIAHFLWPQIATGKLRESGKNIHVAILNCSCITQIYNHITKNSMIKSTMYTKYDLIILFLALTLLSRFTCDCQKSVLDAIYVLFGVSFYKKFHAFSYSISMAKILFQQLWRGVVAALGFELEYWSRNKSHRSFQLFNIFT